MDTMIRFRGKAIPLTALRVVRLWSPDKETFYLTIRDAFGEHDSLPLNQELATELRDKLLALLSKAGQETWLISPDCSLVLPRVSHVGFVLPSALVVGSHLLEILFSDHRGDAHVVMGTADNLEDLRQRLLDKGVAPF